MPQFANHTEGLRVRIVLKPGVAIGPGKADLLQAIEKTASLTAAAELSGMSYKRSWMLVQEMNAAFVEPLVTTAKGGTGGGGGTQLTPLGRRVLTGYRKMETDAGKVTAADIAELRRMVKPDTGAPNRRAAGSRTRRRRTDD